MFPGWEAPGRLPQLPALGGHPDLAWTGAEGWAWATDHTLPSVPILWSCASQPGRGLAGGPVLSWPGVDHGPQLTLVPPLHSV